MSKKQNKQKEIKGKDPEYLLKMEYAAPIGESTGIIKSLPLIFFTAVVIIIVRLKVYTSSTSQFYWAANSEEHIDFFSYYKMAAILVCAAVVILLILYMMFSQTLAVKRTFFYIPMGVYSVFVILSYIFSEYKEFAFLGFNERFEGTLILLSYMLMLFYAINTVNSERNIKFILYPVAAFAALLGLLGISQAAGFDFFQTDIGRMMITPRRFWDYIDTFTFTFTEGQIYQTVYNINYVAFYLTLLLPVFGLLFINSVMNGGREKLVKKVVLCLLFALLLFNMIGAASSGGYLGMGVVVIAAVFLLNRKILTWWKPMVMLLVITLAVGAITFDRWLPELETAIKGTLAEAAVSADAATVPQDSAGEGGGAPATDPQVSAGDAASPADSQNAAGDGESTDNEPQAPDVNEAAGNEEQQAPPVVSTPAKSYIDYIEVHSELNFIEASIAGNALEFYLEPENWPSFEILDSGGNLIGLKEYNEEAGAYVLDDERFDMCSVRCIEDEENFSYFVLNTDGYDWPFLVVNEGTYYVNNIGKITELGRPESIGFENNQNFGTGRGFIWSRTLPLMADTAFIGKGADTFCLYFPQNDYVGKYNMDLTPMLVIDKPHNMYMHVAVGTGGISAVALIALLAFYFAQSIKIYRRRNFGEFMEFAGLGIFLGVLGFSVTGLVDDSTVSVMPMFYGLLGTGIATNMMLLKEGRRKTGTV